MSVGGDSEVINVTVKCKEEEEQSCMVEMSEGGGSIGSSVTDANTGGWKGSCAQNTLHCV